MVPPFHFSPTVLHTPLGKRMLRLTVWVALAMVALALFQATVQYLFGSWETRPTWPHILGWKLLLWAPWLVFAPTVVWLIKRFRIDHREAVVGLALHACIWMVLIALHAIYALGLWAVMFPVAGLELGWFKNIWSIVALGLGIYTLVAYLSPRVFARDFDVTGDGLLVFGEQSGDRMFSYESKALTAIVCDADCDEILAVNRAAVDLYGIPSRELRGRAFRELFVPGTDERFYAELAEAADRLFWGGTARHRKQDGQEMEIGHLSQRIHFKGVPAVLVVLNDLSAKREAERRVRQQARAEADLRAELADAKLRAFEFQLRPHFLFNALNTVGMLISSGEIAKARSVVTSLGEMFRLLLQLEDERFLPLSRELELARRYLEVEQTRFGDRLMLDFDIEERALDVQLPTLIVQPIVENAVKHGAARMMTPSTLSVKATMHDDSLVLEVVNAVAAGPARHGGQVGVKNIQRRLAEIWGDRASFTLTPTDGTMVATLRIPLNGEEASGG